MRAKRRPQDVDVYDEIPLVALGDTGCGQVAVEDANETARHLEERHVSGQPHGDGSIRCPRLVLQAGQFLLAPSPEYIVWDGVEQAYPFVFQTVGDWNVTTSVTPPEGFVADYAELSEQANSEIQAVQFIITEVGSDLVPTESTFQVDHNGRRETIRSHVGIQLMPEYARSRGFDVAELRARGLIHEPPGRRRGG